MTKEKFEVLDDVAHVRRRPGMYIGSIVQEEIEGFVLGKWTKYRIVPGLVKMIDEIIDNAVDEFIRTEGRNGDLIHVEIDEDSWIHVRDNGRGIPVEKHDGKWRPFLCWGAARAGTSFGENRSTIGAHGLGSFLTNVFSARFEGISCDGKKTFRAEWKNGALQSERVTETSRASGVEVRFLPDYPFFGYTEAPSILEDLIKDRLTHLAATYPDLRFKFNGELIRYGSKKEFAQLYAKEGEFFSYENDNQLLIFAPVGKDEEFRFSSHVNGLNVRFGGTPVDVVTLELINELRPLIKRKYKIDALPAHIKNHLLLVQVVRKMDNLQFESQLKDKIKNPYTQVKELFKDVDYPFIARKLAENEAIVKPMVEALLFKKQLEEARELAKEQKANKRIRVANHVPATHPNAEKRILFIAEGDSAIGQLREVRDEKIHGGYALRGKVMNTREMKPLEIVKNKELSELMAILGLKFGQKAEELDYGTIAILTDADVDGMSIMCLLINFFANWPELFQGTIVRVETPVVIARKGKEVKKFYSFAEYQKSGLEGWKVDYIKGLGSLDIEDYKDAINNPRLVMITGEDKKDFDKLDMAFGPDADRRKEWLIK